ncbi:MAG: sulfatase [Rubripirellula sp.]|nr:sulfatase [Rubripirellula sp.]
MCRIQVISLVLLWPFCSTLFAQAERPNILIISIDDLNDWTGCLGGHPQASTPNIDRLATRGTLFRNAHCQAPVCTPSRASLVTGLYPTTTGLYFLQPRLDASPVATAKPNLLRQFSDAGYLTMGAGKFVQGPNENQYFQDYGGTLGGFGPFPEQKLSQADSVKLWDWGPLDVDDAEMPDRKIADWVGQRLQKDHDQPFFLVAGFWRPHVPMYAPSRWFDLFPEQDVSLPLVAPNDRDDLSDYAKTLTIGLPAPRHQWFVENNAWPQAVRSYLASVAFVDDCVGRVMNSLQQSAYRDNTVVILLSDHGWHLGEKQRWAKRSLWNDATRVPLIISAPGFPQDQQCDRPVGLIDIFPTLLDLAKLKVRPDLEGRSVVPLMSDPEMPWDRPILTTFAPRNHSLRSTRWHYIRYGDGSEELYDHQTDQHEWRNLASEDTHRDLIAEMRKRLPSAEAKPIIGEWQKWELDAWRQAEAQRKR